eukprot:g21526.t1
MYACVCICVWTHQNIHVKLGTWRLAGQWRAALLCGNRARLVTEEMGKPLQEATAELAKCAMCLEYYAEHGPAMIADQDRTQSARDLKGLRRAVTAYEPLGVVLAVMPWNFPFWQVIRFAAPALMAGNGILLKHAHTVPGSGLACEALFSQDTGFPKDLFRTLMIDIPKVELVLSNPKVKAVTLTGSEAAGSACASLAARHIKKSVLELGGSDPFVVLPDADLPRTIAGGVLGRFQNCGQSCIASKRFIVVNNQAFIDGFVKAVANLKVGDPLAASTNIGPLARASYAQAMKDFVVDATSKGAQVLVGGTAPAGLDGAGSAYFLPTVVAGVAPGMRMWDEEVFGPVAALICVKDVAEAVRVANATRFGLGASIWTADTEQGMALARQINSGNVFVNHIVASHPSLPFGGVGVSGFGRELAELGLREFRLYREALGGLTLNSTGLKSAALSGLQQSGSVLVGDLNFNFTDTDLRVIQK